MELYLDSANLADIKEAFAIKSLTGLTTTPTFMHKEGVSNLDDTIKELATLVPILQIEALGKDMPSILKEAQRLIDLGLDPSRTVFKIPVSLEGIKACYELRKKNLLVNVHLVYTLQQAYMASISGANYVCPLVGRLQDQGHDALALVSDCVELVEKYNLDTKIMFSSVRNAEHLRNAIFCGAHACTVPWKIMKNLTDNHFTTLGTQEFIQHTSLIILKAKDIVQHKPQVNINDPLSKALLQMTSTKLGIVVVMDEKSVQGVITDGDLRRMLEQKKSIDLNQKISQLDLRLPLIIDSELPLGEALDVFKTKKIDSLVVKQADNYIGVLDIQEVLAAITKF